MVHLGPDGPRGLFFPPQRGVAILRGTPRPQTLPRAARTRTRTRTWTHAHLSLRGNHTMGPVDVSNSTMGPVDVSNSALWPLQTGQEASKTTVSGMNGAGPHPHGLSPPVRVATGPRMPTEALTGKETPKSAKKRAGFWGRAGGSRVHPTWIHVGCTCLLMPLWGPLQ